MYFRVSASEIVSEKGVLEKSWLCLVEVNESVKIIPCGTLLKWRKVLLGNMEPFSQVSSGAKFLFLLLPTIMPRTNLFQKWDLWAG